jgi:hypothetical protein
MQSHRMSGTFAQKRELQPSEPPCSPLPQPCHPERRTGGPHLKPSHQIGCPIFATASSSRRWDHSSKARTQLRPDYTLASETTNKLLSVGRACSFLCQWLVLTVVFAQTVLFVQKKLHSLKKDDRVRLDFSGKKLGFSGKKRGDSRKRRIWKQGSTRFLVRSCHFW